MKSKVFYLFVTMLLTSSAIFAQDIYQSEVPSVIVNSFKKDFPKAIDVEWELEGVHYKVEFEIGRTDYDAWYNEAGKLLKYKQELSARKLPKAIKETIKKTYKGYRIDDVDKYVENNVETYLVEIEKGDVELKLYFNKDGKVIQ